MTAMMPGKMIVGKMQSAKGHGQLSLFSLPQSFDWLEHFSADEIVDSSRNCLTRLIKAGRVATGRWGVK